MVSKRHLRISWSSLVVQQVKELALSLQGFRSLLWCGNFHTLQVQPKKKKKRRERLGKKPTRHGGLTKASLRKSGLPTHLWALNLGVSLRSSSLPCGAPQLCLMFQWSYFHHLLYVQEHSSEQVCP